MRTVQELERERIMCTSCGCDCVGVCVRTCNTVVNLPDSTVSAVLKGKLILQSVEMCWRTVLHFFL